MKKGNFFVFGMLAMVLALGSVFVGCTAGGGDDETDVRTFPENMLGDWSKPNGSDSLSARFYNSEIISERNPVPQGRFSFSPVTGAFIVKDISGNSYTANPTHPDGGRWCKAVNFTAIIGADGKMTISGAKEIADDDHYVSTFDGTSISITDLNGTYTKK
jgi:hypothetical protein